MKSPISDINSLIHRLLKEPLKKLTIDEIKMICYSAGDIFMQQPMLLEIQAPIKIFGDIHGHFEQLLRLLELGEVPVKHNCLFLGDYVDRGKNSLETMCLLLCYKILYPNNFFMLRGNHETAEISKIYGFHDECKRKYNIQIWKIFTQCFSTMPVCALISDRVLCMHGGLSPSLNKLHQIALIQRPAEIPDEGLLADLLWADPWKEGTGYTQNLNRGISYKFGRDVVEDFIKKFDLDLIVRAHQVVEEGYEFFADRKLVTVFSVRNYCGTFDNAGALLNMDEDLICSVEVSKSNFRALKKLSSLNITFREK